MFNKAFTRDVVIYNESFHDLVYKHKDRKIVDKCHVCMYVDYTTSSILFLESVMRCTICTRMSFPEGNAFHTYLFIEDYFPKKLLAVNT